MGFQLLGTGKAVPEKIVKNDDLKALYETSDEWIRTRTGITQRRVITHESVLSLAKEASGKALEEAGVKADEIDFLICATLTEDFITPALSCILLGEIGGKSACYTADINMACCGFINALYLADNFLKANPESKALVVAAEGLSRIADWTDRATSVLFGDGAGAAVLSASDKPCSFDFAVLPSYEHLHATRPTGNCPYHEEHVTDGYLKMNGSEVYKFASSAIDERIRAVLAKANVQPEEVDRFLLHQANIRIIQSAIYKLKLPEEKFCHNIENYGNTSAASVAILLDETRKNNTLKKGDKVVMCAFGAGLASAAVYFEL